METESVFFCLRCGYESDRLSRVFRHLRDDHGSTTPDQEYATISSDGLLYVRDARLNLVWLVHKAISDELAQHDMPVERIDVDDDLVSVFHADGYATVVDLASFLERDHVRRFVLVDPFGLLLNLAEPTVGHDLLVQRCELWLNQNHDAVFADLVERLDVLSRVLAVRGTLDQNMADLLWQDTTAIESLLPPPQPGPDARITDWLDWAMDCGMPAKKSTWQKIADESGFPFVSVKSEYYKRYQYMRGKKLK